MASTFNLLSLLYVVLYLTCCLSHTEMSKLLLVSFDGFRWDYLDMLKKAGIPTPNFDALIANGVKAKYVKNAFVTVTFPNHFSIVTGMYEENHGVVGNTMYDSILNQTFSSHNDDQDQLSKWFNNGSSYGRPENSSAEPIWVTNQIQSDCRHTRRSGVHFWPGSEAPVKNILPYHFCHYNSSVANRTRIDRVVDWFTTEVDPINLGLLYFSEPDHLGHQVGPYHPRMKQMIKELDGVLGYLIEKLQEKGIFEGINIIITSDHGMAEVSKDRVIEMDSLVDPSLYDLTGGTPVWNIWPKKGQEDIIYNKLSGHANLHVFKKAQIPRYFHYTYNIRISPILVAADVGYYLVHNRSEVHFDKAGSHGYNNSVSVMHPIFIAHGPAFKKSFVAEPFEVVDIYPLMCKILGLIPARNDGLLERIQMMLLDEESLFEMEMGTSFITFLLAVGFAALMSGVFIVAALRQHRIRKRMRRTPAVLYSLNSTPINKNANESHARLLTDSEEELP